MAWLVPHETAAVSAQILCTPYNHAPCHFMQSHIRKVYASSYKATYVRCMRLLAVSCAAAITRGGTDSEIRVSTESRLRRRKFFRRSCSDSNPRPFSRESGALTTELFPPNDWSFETYFIHPQNPTQSFRLLVRVPPPPPPPPLAPAPLFFFSSPPPPPSPLLFFIR